MPLSTTMSVDPRVVSPVFGAPDERPTVINAAMPFPPGTVVRIDQAPVLPDQLPADLVPCYVRADLREPRG